VGHAASNLQDEQAYRHRDDGDQGMTKTVFDAKTGELLGAHMVGPEAGEIIQVLGQGFTIGERLLRPAQVGVSSGGPAASRAN